MIRKLSFIDKSHIDHNKQTDESLRISRLSSCTGHANVEIASTTFDADLESLVSLKSFTGCDLSPLGQLNIFNWLVALY